MNSLETLRFVVSGAIVLLSLEGFLLTVFLILIFVEVWKLIKFFRKVLENMIGVLSIGKGLFKRR